MKNKKSNIGKKAQITMFMIVGIVLVIGASFLFYFNSKNADKTTKPSTLKTDDFENYIKTCLKNSLKNNLAQLGLQGGRLYKSQNGLFSDFDKAQKGSFYILDNGEILPYIIDKPYGGEAGSGVELYKSNPPDYPWISFPIRNENITYIGYFGINRIPPLNKPQNYSMEGELESAILADMDACTLQAFENTYEITVQMPKLNVNLNDDSVIAQLNYPITIKDIRSGSKKDFSKFTEEIPVSLKSMFYFAADTINNDISNITYDISSASNKYFTLTIKKNASNYDDIIIITDKNSKIDGKQYKFQFARRNRLPAIEKLITPLTLTEQDSILTKVRSYIKTQDPDEDKTSVFIDGIDETIKMTHAECIDPNYGLIVNITDGQYQDYQEFSLRKGNLHKTCS